MFHVCFCLLIPSSILFMKKNHLTTSAVKLSSSSPYSNSNSETLNFVHFLFINFFFKMSLLQRSNWKHIVLGVDRLNIQVYAKLLLTWKWKVGPAGAVFVSAWGWRENCVTAHARTQQSLASGQTTWTRLNITENNRNVESHNICLAKIFDRDQTSLNLTKQDTTRLNTSKHGGQTHSTLLHSTKFSEV